MCMPQKHYGQKKIAQSTLLSWRRLVTCPQSSPLICLEGTSIAVLFSAHPSLASFDSAFVEERFWYPTSEKAIGPNSV